MLEPPSLCSRCGKVKPCGCTGPSDAKRYADSYEAKSKRPFAKELASARWLKQFRPAILRSNPICQLIEKGQQCHRPGKAVHHLTYEHGFFSWRHVVALCVNHHDHRRGEDSNQPRNFAPTKWNIMGIIEVQEHPQVSDWCTGIDKDGRIRGNE